MTTLAPTTTRSNAGRAVLLLIGFGVAVALRAAIGGVAVADSAGAGLVFASVLGGLTLAVGVRVGWSWRALLLGVASGVALCVPVVVAGAVGAHRPAGSYLSWALVVAVVAFAEELFLRGALFDAVASWRGDYAAVAVTAVAFAALHVPLYGLGVIPLDVAVGVLFGGLRLWSGTVLAPAAAHVTADLLGWWLR